MPAATDQDTCVPPGDLSERSSLDKLLEDFREFDSVELLKILINAMPHQVLVLNGHRQIIYANQALLSRAGKKDPLDLVGSRPGELFNCKNVPFSPGGCGTNEACGTCGALSAILESLRSRQSTRECRIISITREGGMEPLDLRATATPLRRNGNLYCILALEDISDTKRREVLERVFFHDILNTASSIRGLVLLLLEKAIDPEALNESLDRSTESLINEIRSQRMLLNAENHSVKIKWEQTTPIKVIDHIATIYQLHELALGKNIDICQETSCEPIVTDTSLLGRVIGNMLKNALEASRTGETVTLGCTPKEGRMEFWCHNSKPMSREVQLQIFQRSFSTKGPGRGTGTFSIKLIGEKYLHGHVYFRCSEDSGTTFCISLPPTPPDLETPASH